jgi:hypothetical protein
MRIVLRDAVGVYVEVGQRKGRILITWDEIGVLQAEKERYRGVARAVKPTAAHRMVKR